MQLQSSNGVCKFSEQITDFVLRRLESLFAVLCLTQDRKKAIGDKQEIVAMVQVEPCQYLENFNSVKQEIISTELPDIKIKQHPIESEPWQYSQCIKSEIESLQTTEIPYACEHCVKSFTTQGDMSKNNRTHIVKKPYSCENCGKSLSEQGSLNKHIRTHTGDKPYTCDHCGKSFSQRGHLSYHIRTHTVE